MTEEYCHLRGTWIEEPAEIVQRSVEQGELVIRLSLVAEADPLQSSKARRQVARVRHSDGYHAVGSAGRSG
jgi:hypothetical protein